MNQAAQKIRDYLKSRHSNLCRMVYHNLPGHRFSSVQASTIIISLIHAAQACELAEDFNEAQAMYYAIRNGEVSITFSNIVKVVYA